MKNVLIISYYLKTLQIKKDSFSNKNITAKHL